MNCQPDFLELLCHSRPDAFANISGNSDYPCLRGTACFYQVSTGTLVKVEVCNLPFLSDDTPDAFYGMHIHAFGDCSLPFDKTGNHYNPYDLLHPMHLGDMPTLIGNNGYAYMIFYTERFQVDDIINRSIVIHLLPDDFITQPSGNSGEKIGCGVICPNL